ncbi:MAG: hypothetical protein M1834_004711 [Cirrosporium novae-zelandiae]|nr:MAG: hypothetical protein M1834_004711 [Cirrosporium novae-zelandiae]
MAPIPLLVPSNELDRRSSTSSLFNHLIASTNPLLRRSPESELHLNKLSKRTSSPSDFSAGSIDPTTINNNGFFVLFALIGAAFVCTAIWFFFWAKNGGFYFHKRDWDDYKSTVLRRKGPNGTTLSGATKTTDLGGGSVVSAMDQETELGYSVTGEVVNEKASKTEKKKKDRRRHKNNKDNDVLAYREEKPARVGGLNRVADGEYSTPDGSYTAGTSEWASSVVSSNAGDPEMSEVRKPEKAEVAGSKKKRGLKRDFSFTPGSEDSVSNVSGESRRPLRTSYRDHPHRTSRASHSNTTSPSRTRDRTRRERGPRSTGTRSSYTGTGSNSWTEPMDFDAQTESSGTKSYHHPIPGLSKGYRRGGRGRRDSLSESDGETGTQLS